MIEHVVNGYLSSDFFPASKGLLWGIDNVIYGFHMQLFMMVSGYLFSRAYFNEDEVPDKKRILKRVFNHLAVYFVFSFIYGLVKIGIDALSGISLNRTITWVDIAAIPIKPIDLFWYLYVLMLFYLVFSLERLKKAPPMIMMGILVLLSFCSRFISFPWFSVGNLLFYAIFFYMGILKEKRNKFLDSFWVTAISFVAAVALWILFWREPFTVSRLIHYTPIAGTVVGLGGALMVWRIFERTRWIRKCRFLQWLGGYTLEIYLLHIFVSAGLRFVFNRLGLENVYLCLILDTSFSLSCPLLVAVVCKKLGLHSLLFQPVYYFSAHTIRKNSRKNDAKA